MLTVSLLLCAMIALARADDAAPSCPDNFQEFSGRCVQFVSDEKSWGDAEKHCLSMEANLASVHTELEYKLMQMMIKAHANDTLPNAWIGGSDGQKEGSWFWSDGSEFSFQVWCKWQPNSVDGIQHCLEMNFGADKCWNDNDCSTQLPSVCATNMK